MSGRQAIREAIIQVTLRDGEWVGVTHLPRAGFDVELDIVRLAEALGFEPTLDWEYVADASIVEEAERAISWLNAQSGDLPVEWRNDHEAGWFGCWLVE